MGGQIFVEADDVEFLGLPSGAKHLYLVHRDTNGGEYVIRSGPEDSWFGGDMAVEANVPIEASADVRGDETPADRHSTRLDFNGMTTDEAWAIMVKYARAIDAAGYEYRPLEENSNAFIGAMIHAAGGNPDRMRPSGVSGREAVGYSSWDKIVEDIAPPADGIFRGTPGNDRLVGLQIGEHVRALGGRDSVNGRRGDDRLEGGTGTTLCSVVSAPTCCSGREAPTRSMGFRSGSPARRIGRRPFRPRASRTRPGRRFPERHRRHRCRGPRGE